MFDIITTYTSIKVMAMLLEAEAKIMGTWAQKFAIERTKIVVAEKIYKGRIVVIILVGKCHSGKTFPRKGLLPQGGGVLLGFL